MFAIPAAVGGKSKDYIEYSRICRLSMAVTVTVCQSVGRMEVPSPKLFPC